MLRIADNGHPDAAVVALEAYAARAGAALACAYSTSAEYDAALIAERRAAGVYGPKRTQAHAGDRGRHCDGPRAHHFPDRLIVRVARQ